MSLNHHGWNLPHMKRMKQLQIPSYHPIKANHKPNKIECSFVFVMYILDRLFHRLDSFFSCSTWLCFPYWNIYTKKKKRESTSMWEFFLWMRIFIVRERKNEVKKSFFSKVFSNKLPSHKNHPSALLFLFQMIRRS